MDLDKLFTVTDYRLKTIEIKTTSTSSSLDVWCSPQASTDYYLTGQILWPVSILTSHYVAHLAAQGKLSGKIIVELGAGGTCLPSLVAASAAKHVVATDGNGDVVLELLEKNVDFYNQHRDNSSTSGSFHPLSARQLVWGDGAQLRTLLNEFQSFDVVVAADVVQWPAVIEPLLHSAKALLWTSTLPNPVFILGIVNRAGSTYDLFFRLAQELGFIFCAVAPEVYLKDGLVPEACREFGGRVTEMYELILQKDQCDPPILLSDKGETLAITTGKGFEHTLALPC